MRDGMQCPPLSASIARMDIEIVPRAWLLLRLAVWWASAEESVVWWLFGHCLNGNFRWLESLGCGNSSRLWP